MSDAKIIRLEIPCSPEYVIVARRTVEGLATRLGLSGDETEDVKLAVGEACTNAVKYSSREKAPVSMLCNVAAGDRLEIEVRNVGDPFDPPERCIAEPLADASREGGLGIYLIENVMDEMSINSENGETVVKMVKLLREQGTGGQGTGGREQGIVG